MALIGPQGGARRPVKIVAILAAALVLAALAVRSGAYMLAAQGDDCVRALVRCDDGLIGLAAARARLAAAGRPSSAVGAPLTTEAAIDAPLAALPLIDGGLAALSTGDRPRARLLLASALRREPRSAEPRAFLIDDAVRAHRYADAVREGDRLSYIVPGFMPEVAALFAALANVPAARPALAQAIAHAPPWRGAMYALLRERKADPGVSFQLLDRTHGDDVAEVEQAKLIDALVAGGDYERAYLAWTSFLPPSALSGIAYIYDGGFDGRPGARPFNWLLLSGSEGSVEIAQGALAVEYYGRATVGLAQQTVLVPAGDFVLRIVGHAGGAAGTLRWTLRCAADSRILAQATMDRLSASGVFAVPFRIDGVCPAQVLQLDGVASDVAEPANARFDRLSIARAG